MKYRHWNLRPQNMAGEAALMGSGVPPLAALALSTRGVDTLAGAEEFLSADPSLLPDPMLLQDMPAAVARIHAALCAGERVAVYGDYDVDGITASCLLTHYLRACGGDVTTYIPDRLEEGYGLGRQALETLSGQGVKLIITVDCGITAVEEARYARELGMDLLITDHHECKSELPAAVAVVDPHREDCPYPNKTLAGVGVALKLVLALGGREEHDTLLRRYADLAAIGTVADVMPLIGENRAIVRLGLDAISRAPRPGLRALLEEAGLADKPLTSSAIGYTLAPRINASGRMGCAGIAAELLLTEDAHRAAALAQTLCSLNRERQTIELGIFEACVTLADATPTEERFALVLSSPQWHQGVVGIVASRLSEKYSCPTFMICLQDGHGKGSCRSYGGFNLFAALQECADLLEGFGGHELAAGFTIAEGQIPLFRARMNAIVSRATGGSEMVSTLDVDAPLEDSALLTLEQVSALDLLEPFGCGNPRPVFLLAGCGVTALSEVGGGRHLKLKVSFKGRVLDAIFFSATADDCGICPGDRVDLAFHLQINEYRGRRSVQLQLCDLRPAMTRAQQERALYEKYRRGEPLTPTEAHALTPSREEFALLWRYLKTRAVRPVEEPPIRLARNVAHASGTREAFPRTMVCLDVFHERGLVRVERSTDHLRIDVNEGTGKVNLEESYILRNLRKLSDN